MNARYGPTDPAMARVLTAFVKSGLTMRQLGRAMGYPDDSAAKSVWQFLNGTRDPRVSTLRRFAEALGLNIEDLVTAE